MKSIDKVLVTGAGGLVGSAVCHFLNKTGIPVIGIYRKMPSEEVAWDILSGDLTDKHILKELAKLEFSSLVHAAAAIPGYKHTYEDCYQINTKIDENIYTLLRLKKSNINLVFFSTTNLYKQSDLCISEDFEINISNKYARSKIEAEGLFLDQFPNTVVLRINAPYGPKQQSKTVLKIFIERAIKGKKLYFYGSGNRQQDFTHVNDIAKATTLAIERKAKGIFNIASGNPISMKDLAYLVISKVPGTKSKVLPSGEDDSQEGFNARFSIRKAKNKFGWGPEVNLDAGIRDWVKHLSQ